AWCANAAALLLFVSKTTTDKGTPAITHSYDTGAAWLSLALQGSLKGWVVHGMQGFDYAKAKTVLAIPDDHRVEAMAAIGRPGDPAALPEKLRAREAPSLRKALGEIVCEGKFGF